VGKGVEVVFLPKKLVDTLKDYLKARGTEGTTKEYSPSPILPTGSWSKRPALVGVHLRPDPPEIRPPAVLTASSVPWHLIRDLLALVSLNLSCHGLWP
jgi:hypothetical protein